MFRALCFVCASVALATGQTPFDFAGIQLSESGASEMAVTVLVLLAAMLVQD